MDDIGALLFKYFEKILAVLFGLALLISVILYGPWVYSTGFDAQLAEIARLVEDTPRITVAQVPPAPNYSRYFETARLAPPQQALEQPLFWDVLPMEEGVQVLPPMDVSVVPDRGFVEIDWEYNPTQPPTAGIAEFVGIEIARARVGPDGRPGEFTTVTRVDDRDYYTPRELYENNARYAPLVTTQRTAEAADTRRRTTGLTVDDLFNAVYDGRLEFGQVLPIMRRGVRTGEFTAEDVYNVNNMLIEMRMEGPMLRQDIMMETGEDPGSAEVLRLILEAYGYTGGGRYGRTPEEPVRPTDREAEPDERIVRWGEVFSYFDSTVSPDDRYAYRVRFWARDTTTTPAEFRQSSWAEVPQPVSPRADTEFFLTGGSVLEGRPWIRVRRWMPAQERWISQDYQVAIGEEIGRREELPRLDSQGRTVRDERGNVVMDTVDFSTQAVLLDFVASPRVAATQGARAARPGIAVDTAATARYPMLSQTHIVYSNRRGELRRKWQAPAASRR